MGWVREILRGFPGKPHRGIRPDAEQPDRTLKNGSTREFQELIGYTIRDPAVFNQALLHRSSLQQASRPDLSNERLEFLGDSVLNLVAAEYLFQRFPDAEEGELTKIRSRLVNRKALAAYGKEIRLSKFIRMSQSAAQAVGKGYDTIIADTYEAVIAAIYLDGGYGSAKKFVERQVLAALNRGSVATSDENYKSMLLEYAQAKGLGTPRYNITREDGPDHDRTFTVEVIVNNVTQGRGTGKNKKEAEQAAACAALEKLENLP
jgi:ribonuclease-3